MFMFAIVFSTLNLSSDVDWLSNWFIQETNELMRKEGDSQLRSQQIEISELRAKLVTLEQALGIMSGEFEQEREEVERRAMVSMQANSTDLEKLEILLDAREKELGHVKWQAQSIIEQRKKLELFFHEALDHVRKEIRTQQHLYRFAQVMRTKHCSVKYPLIGDFEELHTFEDGLVCRQEALKAYRWRMNEARAGRLEYPRIRTFSNAPHSTNDVQTDLEEADKWCERF